MKFTVITLFPQLIDTVVEQGLLGQAREKGLVRVDCVNPRDFTDDAHRTVDDRAFGGGDGMVMKAEPLARALRSLGPAGNRHVTVLTPQGRTWRQADAIEWAGAGADVERVLVCGRYAGIDHRFTVKHADDEISLGDFVLNGGEVAAAAIIESVARLLPGALGNAVSSARDSFTEPMLECPQFTRPRETEGLPVPAPLLSGNHQKIAEFERAVALVRTNRLRPDLLDDPGDLEGALALVGALADDELTALGLTRADLDEMKVGLK